MSGSNTGPLGVPPGGPYFVFPASGTIQRQSNPVLAETLVATGWVGFATMADAQAAASTKSLPAQARAAGTAVTGAVTSTEDFLSRFTSPQLWLRVAEVALGLALIVVGLAKMSNASTTITKTATKIGEAAALT